MSEKQEDNVLKFRHLTAEVQIIRLNPNLKLPELATTGSAALDLQANIENPWTLEPGKPAKLVPTGIKLYLGDPGICALILPRSGLGHNCGINLGNTVGLIDSDYQGELMVSLWLRPDYEPFTIYPEDRIAQLLLTPVVFPVLQEVQEFNQSTKRGANGFNSTGIR